jgi:hypothetical protein
MNSNFFPYKKWLGKCFCGKLPNGDDLKNIASGICMTLDIKRGLVVLCKLFGLE